MNILVTGHKGYIGTLLTPMLLKLGHTVRGIDSDLYRECTYGNGIPEIPETIKDIRDIEISDLNGIDAVIHLAALSNDPLGDLDPQLTDEINYQGTIRVAEVAKKAGVKRFVFSSSCSNYGASGDDFIDETGQFNPVTPYGKSKVKSEMSLGALADDSFCTTSLRSGTAYGVSPRLRFDLVLNNLTAWAFTTGKVYLKSDGTPWRPIVHIEDISRAFISVLHAPEEQVRGKAFNVGVTDENYQIRDLATIVKETVPGCEVTFASDAGPDKRNYRVNCDLLPQTLSEFQPCWTARKGAQELYQSFRKSDITLDDFEGPRYKRIDHIRMLIEKGLLDHKLRWKK